MLLLQDNVDAVDLFGVSSNLVDFFGARDALFVRQRVATGCTPYVIRVSCSFPGWL